MGLVFTDTRNDGTFDVVQSLLLHCIVGPWCFI